VKEVRAFLGLASFYKRLVSIFAEIAKPLMELTRKDEDVYVRTSTARSFPNYEGQALYSACVGIP
jgi:hypothetical protein